MIKELRVLLAKAPAKRPLRLSCCHEHGNALTPDAICFGVRSSVDNEYAKTNADRELHVAAVNALPTLLDDLERARGEAVFFAERLEKQDHQYSHAHPQAAMYRHKREALESALAHASEALRAAMPSGHDGDEDAPGCYPDCAKCAVEGAVAHIEEALSVGKATPSA